MSNLYYKKGSDGSYVLCGTLKLGQGGYSGYTLVPDYCPERVTQYCTCTSTESKVGPGTSPTVPDITGQTEQQMLQQFAETWLNSCPYSFAMQETQYQQDQYWAWVRQWYQLSARYSQMSYSWSQTDVRCIADPYNDAGGTNYVPWMLVQDVSQDPSLYVWVAQDTQYDPVAGTQGMVYWDNGIDTDYVIFTVSYKDNNQGDRRYIQNYFNVDSAVQILSVQTAIESYVGGQLSVPVQYTYTMPGGQSVTSEVSYALSMTFFDGGSTQTGTVLCISTPYLHIAAKHAHVLKPTAVHGVRPLQQILHRTFLYERSWQQDGYSGKYTRETTIDVKPSTGIVQGVVKIHGTQPGGFDPDTDMLASINQYSVELSATMTYQGTTQQQIRSFWQGLAAELGGTSMIYNRDPDQLARTILRYAYESGNIRKQHTVSSDYLAYEVQVLDPDTMRPIRTEISQYKFQGTIATALCEIHWPTSIVQRVVSIGDFDHR